MLGWGLRFRFSNKRPGEVKAVGPGTALCGAVFAGVLCPVVGTGKEVQSRPGREGKFQEGYVGSCDCNSEPPLPSHRHLVGRGCGLPGLCTCSDFWRENLYVVSAWGRRRKEGDCTIVYGNCLLSVTSCISPQLNNDLEIADELRSSCLQHRWGHTAESSADPNLKHLFLPVGEVVEEC